MATPRQHAAPRRPSRPRALLAGLILVGAIGSCELPKPQLPSIGATGDGQLGVVHRGVVQLRIVRP